MRQRLHEGRPEGLRHDRTAVTRMIQRASRSGDEMVGFERAKGERAAAATAGFGERADWRVTAERRWDSCRERRAAFAFRSRESFGAQGVASCSKPEDHARGWESSRAPAKSPINRADFEATLTEPTSSHLPKLSSRFIHLPRLAAFASPMSLAMSLGASTLRKR
jgi:hypothetical protein